MLLRFGEEWPDVHELTGRIASLPASNSQSWARASARVDGELGFDVDRPLIRIFLRIDVRQANLRK